MKVRTRVRLTIEIASNDVWSEETPVNRVYAQASEATMRDVQKFTREWGSRTTLVEKPVVTMVLVEQEHD
jgi:hypothetical protein